MNVGTTTARFDLEEHRDALAAFFAASDDVVLAYLFGSLEARLRITAGVAVTMSTEDVDVLILNDAAPALAYEVLRDGVLLFCRDHDARVAFQVHTINQHLDFTPILERHRRAIFESARKGELLDGYDRHRGA